LERLRPIGSFFLKHPAIGGSLLYIQVTAVGVIYSWALFRRFDISVFDYAEANDFLLAAFKDPFVFGMSLTLAFLSIVMFFATTVMFRRWSDREVYDYEDYEARETWEYFAIFVMWATPILFFPCSLLVPYFYATSTAESLLQGPTDEPLTSVQYRATSGSKEQTTETGLRVIGTTQSFVFFYDKKETRTLIIPNAQIVEMEHSVKKP